MRGEELARLGALAGLQAAEEFAVGVELLNAAVDRRDPNVVVRIDSDPDGAFEVGDFVFEAGELAAEAARFVFQVAPRQDRLAFASQLLDSAQHPFGRVEVAALVEGQKLRAADSRLGIDVAAKLAGLSAVLAELRKEFSVLVEDLHAAVRLIGDVDSIVRTNREATGKVEFTVPVASLAPLAQQLASWCVDRDAVGMFFFAQAADGKVRDEQRAVAVGGDASGVRQDFQRREMLAVEVERLHAVVVVIGDEDRLFVNRDPDRELELAVGGSFLAPDFHESRRSSQFIGDDGFAQQAETNEERNLSQPMSHEFSSPRIGPSRMSVRN
ncbi:MAG: hypothetical protein FD138_1641 [Planctomycetota bacterium]|nr:MAG: hypothetical protein FD138_1641 [Planctomycetota bacterium]